MLYTAMGTTFVAFAGPPCVRSHGIGKYWKALIAARRMATIDTGFSSGNVIFQNLCQGLAPSTSAARRISSSMAERPASSTTNWNGKLFQTMTVIRDPRA